MKALIRLASIETRLFFRERQAVVWTFLFPILMIWLFGEMFGGQKVDGRSFSDIYIPSWIAVNLLTTSLYTIGTTLSTYRQTGILRRLRATPLRPFVVLGSHVFYGLIVFVMSAIVLAAFGFLFFHLSIPKYLAGTLLAILVSIMALFPFGLFMANLAKNARTAAAMSTLLLNVMIFLSGATFPLQMMPKLLRDVAYVLPLYYVIDLVRHTWNFSSFLSSRLDVFVLLGMFVVFTVLSARFFKWEED